MVSKMRETLSMPYGAGWWHCRDGCVGSPREIPWLSGGLPGSIAVSKADPRRLCVVAGYSIDLTWDGAGL